MYTMKEACKRVNMSYETLKYYCNQDLVPNLQRDKNNHRVFDDKNIAWLDSLQCLRKAGMSMKDMKDYMNYCLAGKSTIKQRQEMLKNTKKGLLKQIATLNESLNYIEAKNTFYNGVLEGKIKYISNLIDVE